MLCKICNSDKTAGAFYKGVSSRCRECHKRLDYYLQYEAAIDIATKVIADLQQARAAERERCAKVCEAIGSTYAMRGALRCAAAIRALTDEENTQ